MQIIIESFVQISFSVFYKSCFYFPKIDKFQLISYKIFLIPSKRAFLTMYADKKTASILAVVYIFIIKTLKYNWENLFLEPHFATITPLMDFLFCLKPPHVRSIWYWGLEHHLNHRLITGTIFNYRKFRSNRFFDFIPNSLFLISSRLHQRLVPRHQLGPHFRGLAKSFLLGQ